MLGERSRLQTGVPQGPMSNTRFRVSHGSPGNDTLLLVTNDHSLKIPSASYLYMWCRKQPTAHRFRSTLSHVSFNSLRRVSRFLFAWLLLSLFSASPPSIHRMRPSTNRARFRVRREQIVASTLALLPPREQGQSRQTAYGATLAAGWPQTLAVSNSPRNLRQKANHLTTVISLLAVSNPPMIIALPALRLPPAC